MTDHLCYIWRLHRGGTLSRRQRTRHTNNSLITWSMMLGDQRTLNEATRDSTGGCTLKLFQKRGIRIHLVLLTSGTYFTNS